jgi:hypothetical protein
VQLLGKTEKGVHVVIHYIGIAIFCIGALFILVQAFEKGTGWGIAMLIAGGLLWPVFVLKYWKDTSFWFFVSLAGGLAADIFRA